MTKEEIKKFLDNTKVYVNGKSREIQEKLFSFGYTWNWDNRVKFTKEPFLFISGTGVITHSNDMVLFNKYEYREITADEILSLEITEPSYRPFKDVEECWQEMLKHEPFGWLKSKESGTYANIAFLATNYNKSYIVWFANEKERVSLSYVYDIYTFADGTPFGIKEE